MTSMTAKAADTSGNWRWTMVTLIASAVFIAGVFEYQESVFPMIGFTLVFFFWTVRTTHTWEWLSGSWVMLRITQILTIVSPLSLAFIAADDNVYVNLNTGETTLSGVLIVLPFVTPIAHIPITYSVEREQSLDMSDVGTFKCGMSLEGVSLDVRDPRAISDFVISHAAAGDLKTYIPLSLRTTMDDVLANVLKQASTGGDGRMSELFDEASTRVRSELSSLHLRSHNFALSYTGVLKLKVP